MAKSGRGNAPRDRKRGLQFPKPPCDPTPPRQPPPPRPPGPGDVSLPDPRKLLERLRKKT